MRKRMNVLVIAPHMDDEVLGCGGVLCRHMDAGDKIWVIFIACRIYDHKFDEDKNKIEKTHSLKAKEILNYNEAIFLDMNDEKLDVCIQEIIIPLEKHIERIKPEIVYIPFKGDNNQDHRAVFDATRVVLRSSVTPFIKKVLMYEVPSSTEQSPPLIENVFLPNYYVNIKEYFDTKIQALRCYETEKRNFPHPRSDKALKVLAQKRGTEIGFEYAEAFMIIREKWE